MNNNERINIVPIIAANISDSTKTISNIFDTISFKKGTEGKFFVDFLINALINEKYLIKYILVRKNEDKYEALSFDDFIISPDKYLRQNERSSFNNSNIISEHTIIEIKHNTINQSGEYDILAFGKKIETDEVIDDIDNSLDDMDLLCEKHFFVNIQE